MARPTGRAIDVTDRRTRHRRGADVVAPAVARSYRKRAGQATGWPLVSWLLRLRPDPLARLGLGPKRRGEDPALHRTSMPALDAGARARVRSSVRGFADAATAGLTDAWRTGIRTTADRAITELPDQLDLAIARTPLPAKGSWWWVIFSVLQWVSVLAALVGIGWLLGAAFLPTFGLPAFEVPKVEGWAVPTLLIAGGVALGILLGLLGAALAAAAAASRRRRTRKLLLASVGAVVQPDRGHPDARRPRQRRGVHRRPEGCAVNRLISTGRVRCGNRPLVCSPKGGLPHLSSRAAPKRGAAGVPAPLRRRAAAVLRQAEREH